MDTTTRPATKVSTFFKNLQSMSMFCCNFQLCIYEDISYKTDDCSFIIDSIFPNEILSFFGDYYVFVINPALNEDTNHPVMKLCICKNRPAGSFWSVID